MVVVCDLSMSVIGGKIVDVLVPEKGTSLLDSRVSKSKNEACTKYSSTDHAQDCLHRVCAHAFFTERKKLNVKWNRVEGNFAWVDTDK